MTARKPNRTEKIMALAATEGYNPAEAAAAQRKLQLVPEGSDAVALVRLATRALEQANALPDIIEVADKAAAIRTYVQRVRLGVAAENEAAELVIRAEAKAGGELQRMLSAGERAPQAGTNRRSTGGLFGASGSLPTIADFGIDHNAAVKWQKLARLSDESIRTVAAAKIEAGERLSRADFLREVERIAPTVKRVRTPVHPMDGPPKVIEQPAEVPYVRDVTPPDEGDAWSVDWQAMLGAAHRLGDDLTHGWPVQGDRSTEAWTLVNDEINEAGRSLLWFQKRVKEYMA